MLRKPRRLPQRFNRPVAPQTRNLVQRRHQRAKQQRAQKFQRAVQRIRRRAGSLRKLLMQFAVFIVAGLVLLGIGLALFSPILHIREIRVQRTDPRIDAEKIQMSLGPLFGEHLFFLSTQEVSDLLQASIPDLVRADIVKQYPATLQIRVYLDPIIAQLIIDEPDRTPQQTASGAVVAAQTGAVEIPEGGEFLTQKGLYVVYQPSQVRVGSGGLLQLRLVDWGERPEPWKRLVEPKMLDVMRSAEGELQTQFGLVTQSREVYIRAREFHLKLPQHTLWFDTRSPLSEQLQRYRFFLQSVGAAAATQYVDLRLTDKIVYR